MAPQPPPPPPAQRQDPGTPSIPFVAALSSAAPKLSETLPPAFGAAIGGGPGPPLPVLRPEPRETPPTPLPSSCSGALEPLRFLPDRLPLPAAPRGCGCKRLSRSRGRIRQRRRFHVPVIGGSWHLCCPRRHGLRSCGMRALSPWSLACPPKVEISDGGGSRSSYLRNLGDVVYFEGMGRLGMHTIKLDFALISRGLLEMVREVQVTSCSSCWL